MSTFYVMAVSGKTNSAALAKGSRLPGMRRKLQWKGTDSSCTGHPEAEGSNALVSVRRFLPFCFPTHNIFPHKLV